MELSRENIIELIKNKNIKELRNIFEEFNSVDIAETIDDLSQEQLLFLFKTIPASSSAEVFTYLSLESKENLINLFSSNEINKVMDEIYADDIADFIVDLPANLVRKILRSINKELRENVNKILDYPEDSVGSIMNIDYIELTKEDSAKEAIEKIRKIGNDVETISYAYIVDDKRNLIGYVSLKTILLANDNQLIEQIMETDLVSVNVFDDKENAVLIFKKYDMSVLPVVNKENKLLGIITADDVLDVAEEEATEDIQLMSGSAPLEDLYLDTSVFQLAKKRIGWLLILMVTAVFTSMIINRSEQVLLALPALAVFMPMLNDAAGNSGNQATGLVTRGIAINTIKLSDWAKVIWKEFRVALCIGSIMAIASYGWMWLENLIGIVSVSNTKIFAVASLSLFLAIIIAKTLGACLPLLAKLCKLDPAVMAGPLVTTIVDASTVALYYGLAKILLL